MCSFNPELLRSRRDRRSGLPGGLLGVGGGDSTVGTGGAVFNELKLLGISGVLRLLGSFSLGRLLAGSRISEDRGIMVIVISGFLSTNYSSLDITQGNEGDGIQWSIHAEQNKRKQQRSDHGRKAERRLWSTLVVKETCCVSKFRSLSSVALVGRVDETKIKSPRDQEREGTKL